MCVASIENSYAQSTAGKSTYSQYPSHHSRMRLGVLANPSEHLAEARAGHANANVAGQRRLSRDVLRRELYSMSPSKASKNGAKHDKDNVSPSSSPEGLPDRTRQASRDTAPSLIHRMKHNASILALALSSDRIFAGTQKGQILVFELLLSSPDPF